VKLQELFHARDAEQVLLPIARPVPGVIDGTASVDPVLFVIVIVWTVDCPPWAVGSGQL
jgi:hypothetical protein